MKIFAGLDFRLCCKLNHWPADRRAILWCCPRPTCSRRGPRSSRKRRPFSAICGRCFAEAVLLVILMDVASALLGSVARLIVVCIVPMPFASDT